MQTTFNLEHLRPGLSGIMRVKNDASLIAAAVASCVDALDELIIVYNDCTDGSESVILDLQARHPDKIRAFAYPYKVLSTGLTREEAEEAMALQEDSPHLLCNYYNFALSKVTCRYAMKIDADQFYFPDVLGYWAGLCRSGSISIPVWKRVVGALVDLRVSGVRAVSKLTKHQFNFGSSRLIRPFVGIYRDLAAYKMLKGRASVSLSGLNVYHDGSRWMVPLGGRDADFRLPDPFNGEGDHLIFRMDPSLRYERCFDPNYGIDRSRYNVIEAFRGAPRARHCGFAWFHVTTMRPQLEPRVRKMLEGQPERFVPLDEFLGMPYRRICARSDSSSFGLSLRSYFNWTFKAFGYQLADHLDCLRRP